MFSDSGLWKSVWLKKRSQHPHALLTSSRGSSWRSPGAAQTLADVICSLSHSFPALSTPAVLPGSWPQVHALALGTAPPVEKPGPPSPLLPLWWLHSQSVENHNKNLSSLIILSIAQTAGTNCISAYDFIPIDLCILFSKRPIWSAYGLQCYSKLAILTTSFCVWRGSN